MKLWHKITIIVVFLLLALSLVFGETTMNFLTKGQADQLYCAIGGSCGSTSGGANLTGSGDSGKVAVWDNQTHITYTNDVYATTTQLTDTNISIVDYIASNNMTLNEFILYVNSTANVSGDNSSWNESYAREIIIGNNDTLIDYILYVNSTNGEGGLGSDLYINETGDSMTGDLVMLSDKCYKWSDGSEICVQSNGNMVFQLG